MAISEVALEAAFARAGHHSKEAVPEDREQRIYFGLLEILDFQCIKYKDFTLATEKEIKEYLYKHRDNIKCSPPSYIGLLVGAFNFLVDGDQV